MLMKNKWQDGIFGVVVGDALGCPVEFDGRDERKADPVTGMRGFGTFGLPKGSWTDDSSLTLAALDSLGEKETADFSDMMRRFARWLKTGDYTPYGTAFDVGRGTEQAIRRWLKDSDFTTCGGTADHDNGNGSLMRIMPICLWCFQQEQADRMSREEAVATVHTASALTHNHLRSKIACGLYYFMAVSILSDKAHTPLPELLQQGITEGWKFYGRQHTEPTELTHYRRLLDLQAFAALDETEIRSTGYVVDTLEAAVWSLVTTDSYADAMLRAVNLGLDTDTVAAIAGGALVGVAVGLVFRAGASFGGTDVIVKLLRLKYKYIKSLIILKDHQDHLLRIP